jgi:hypothetical protein
VEGGENKKVGFGVEETAKHEFLSLSLSLSLSFLFLLFLF